MKKRIHILNPMKAVLFHGGLRIDTSIVAHELTDEAIRYLESIGFKIKILGDSK